MKIILILLLSFITLNSTAQDSNKVFSYYLNSNKTPFSMFNNIETFHYGTYKLKAGKSTVFNNYELRMEAGEDLVIDELGIYILKNKILSISRTQVREDSKYRVSNGYLYGIVENDSVAVALQDELFYFLMPTKSFLFEANNSNQFLFKAETAYLVLSKEKNGFYSSLKINIQKNNISLSELDLNYSQSSKISHTITTENTIKTFLFTPTSIDWIEIINSFAIYDNYSIIK